ncbi:MAG: diguanylate cyclase [Acidimicrobiia bacterium]|nr:diguanylate cyclase [Acidimicrobiia bacterium]
MDGRPSHLLSQIFDFGGRGRRDQNVQHLIESQQLFASIAEWGPLAVAHADPEGRVTYLNARWRDLVDEPDRRLPEFGWQDILLPEYVHRINELGAESVRTGQPFQLRVRARQRQLERSDRVGRADIGIEGVSDGLSTGLWGELRARAQGIRDPTVDDVLGFTASLIDVTAEVAAAERADRLAQVLDASSDFVLLANPAGAITYANEAAVSALDVRVAPERPEGSYIWDVLDWEATDVYYEHIEDVLQREGIWRGELALRRSTAGEGGTIPVSALFLAHTDEHGRIAAASVVARDITELKDAETRLRHLANHDSLTGLPNRALLYDRLEQSLARYHRLGHGVALFFCDLDEFKPVNDELGHDAGDRVLEVIATRIGEVVRATDTAARVGGDEFVVLVEGVDDIDLLRGVAERLIASISQPVAVGDRDAVVGASIGLVVARDGRDDIDSLLRSADRAMYRAKAAGRGRVEVLDES